MSRPKALLGIVLILLVGIIIGVGLSIRISMLQIRDLAAGTPQELAQITISRMHQKVKFTPDQHRQAIRIAQAAEEEIEAVQAKVAPEIDAIAQRAQTEIHALLSPAQLQQLSPEPSK